MSAIADTIVMVRPDHFGYNSETAPSNSFQVLLNTTSENIRQQALGEFKGILDTLEANGIKVLVLDGPKGVITPDEVFPNNWFYTDNAGRLVLFPMCAPNRRAERQVNALKLTLTKTGFEVSKIIDLTWYEKQDQSLEGTGSMVLDRQHSIAFAIGSPRTDEEVFRDFCHQCGYTPVFFHAKDRKGEPIYHTNVIMAVGDGFTVLCEESITDKREREHVLDIVHQISPVLVTISLEQVTQFCGNLLNLRSKNRTNKIIMSKTAFEAFTPKQLSILKEHGALVPLRMKTIETIGGGSARCAIAEIFLPRKIK